jgi:hypothetical protein
VAALVPVESAMRMTGSAGSVAVFSEAFFTTELESVGQLLFCADVERSRVSCAETNRAGTDKRTRKRSTVEMNFENLFMMKDNKPGERAGKAILLQNKRRRLQNLVVTYFAALQLCVRPPAEK